MNSIKNDTADRSHAGARNAASSAAMPAGQAGAALYNEFDALVADAEDLVKHTVDTLGSQTSSARAKLQSTLARAKDQIALRADALGKQGRVAASVTDDYIRDRPWQAIGVAAVVGLAVGALLSRR